MSMKAFESFVRLKLDSPAEKFASKVKAIKHMAAAKGRYHSGATMQEINRAACEEMQLVLSVLLAGLNAFSGKVEAKPLQKQAEVLFCSQADQIIELAEIKFGKIGTKQAVVLVKEKLISCRQECLQRLEDAMIVLQSGVDPITGMNIQPPAIIVHGPAVINSTISGQLSQQLSTVDSSMKESLTQIDTILSAQLKDRADEINILREQLFLLAEEANKPPEERRVSLLNGALARMHEMAKMVSSTEKLSEALEGIVKFFSP